LLEKLRRDREKLEKELEAQVFDRERAERDRIARDRLEREAAERRRREVNKNIGGIGNDGIGWRAGQPFCWWEKEQEAAVYDGYGWDDLAELDWEMGQMWKR
jgi:hypothetical protein